MASKVLNDYKKNAKRCQKVFKKELKVPKKCNNKKNQIKNKGLPVWLQMAPN